MKSSSEVPGTDFPGPMMTPDGVDLTPGGLGFGPVAGGAAAGVTGLGAGA
jgi:hypothetical protein